MKFVCDRCSTQYLISDDKVGPRGVKVRCKRCGHTILVRPQDEESPETSMPTDPSARPLGSELDRPGDEVGQAFDDLLAGQLDGGDEDDEDEEQATEIFRMEDLQRSQSSGPIGDEDKLDEVFAAAASSRVEVAGDQDNNEWYVAVGDEQVGPMRLGELEDRWSRGEIQADSLVWHPGMGDWSALQHTAELKYLLGSRPAGSDFQDRTDVDSSPEAAAGHMAPAPSPKQEEEWVSSQRSELASLVEEEIAAEEKPVELEAPAKKEEVESPLGGFPESDDDGDLPPWERDDIGSGEVARPSDDLFDSTLDSAGDDGAGYFGGYGRSGSALGAPAYLGGDESGSSKWKWIAIGGGGLVLLIVVALGLFFFLQEVEPEKDPGLGEPIKPPVGAQAGEGKGDDKADDKGDKADDKGDKTDDKADDKGDKADDKGDKTDDKADDKGDKAEEQLVVGRPSSDRDGRNGKKSEPSRVTDKPRPASSKRKRRTVVKKTEDPKPTPKPQPAGDSNANSSLASQPSKADILGTMKKYQGVMKSCVEQQQQRDPSVKGTMVVSFTIESSGKVSAAKVLTAEHKGSYVAGCISQIIKAMKFPKFGGPAYTVPKFPFRLGG